MCGACTDTTRHGENTAWALREDNATAPATWMALVSVAVAAAGSHAREAERILREDVCDRSDEGEAPMEPSERTETIIRSHDWLIRGKAAS